MPKKPKREPGPEGAPEPDGAEPDRGREGAPAPKPPKKSQKKPKAGGPGAPPDLTPDEALVEVELARIVISETSDQQVILLRERAEPHRAFPIIIGIFEAVAIDRKLKEIKIPRPLTHDLLDQVIRRLGGTLERIVINDLSESTFYARLLIAADGRRLSVDSRPSDAIALAVRAGVPIFVAEKVFAKAASPGG